MTSHRYKRCVHCQRVYVWQSSGYGCQNQMDNSFLRFSVSRDLALRIARLRGIAVPVLPKAVRTDINDGIMFMLAGIAAEARLSGVDELREPIQLVLSDGHVAPPIIANMVDAIGLDPQMNHAEVLEQLGLELISWVHAEGRIEYPWGEICAGSGGGIRLRTREMSVLERPRTSRSKELSYVQLIASARSAILPSENSVESNQTPPTISVDAEYCPDCKSAIVQALDNVPVLFKQTWVETDEIDINTLLEHRKTALTKAQEDNPNRLIVERVMAPLFDLRDPDNVCANYYIKYQDKIYSVETWTKRTELNNVKILMEENIETGQMRPWKDY